MRILKIHHQAKSSNIFEELGYEFEPIDTPDVDDMDFKPENSTKEDTALTHFASEKVLAKDWSSPTEDEVWRDL